MITYPIYFLNGTCPHCASDGLSYLDKFGKETKMLIYPINNIICRSCNRRFFIQWNKDEEGTFIPVTCAKSSITKFENRVAEFTILNRRKLE